VADRVPISRIVQAFQDYVALARGLGFEVRKCRVRRHALASLDYQGDMKSFFNTAYARRHPHRTAPAQVLHAVVSLRDDLMQVIKQGLNGELPDKDGAGPTRVVKVLAQLDENARRRIVEQVNGTHRPFLRAAEVPVEAFHKALDAYAAGQSLSRGRLVQHLQAELLRRGVHLSAASIEERLRRNTKVRTVPAALMEIVASLGAEFRSGLVPLATFTGAEDPAAWLEHCRQTLGFPSKNALHKALAAATGVNYETVHKALTRPQADRRVRVEIRDTLLDWLERVRNGQPLPVEPAAPRRTRPRADLRKLLRRLEACYDDPENLYADAARAVGLSPEAIRKVHREGGAAQIAPEHLAALRELLKNRRRARRPRSYLRNPRIRRTALRLARRIEEARQAWMAHPHDDALRRAFRRLRLQMIITLKQGRTPDLERLDAAACPDEDSLDSVAEEEYVALF